jgi:diguanylate cyclase (GGDEF)-like protein/PAS domain S-box-containing protein
MGAIWACAGAWRDIGACFITQTATSMRPAPGRPSRTRPAVFAALSVLCAALPFEFTALAQPAAPSAQLRPIHSLKEIFLLSKAEAQKAYPIDFEAVVTYSDPEWGVLFIQGPDGPTYVDVHGISTHFLPGSRVHVKAETGVNKDGPILAHPKITVLGRGVLPKPVQATVADLSRGAHESEIVIAEGVLRPCDRAYMRVCYSLTDGDKAVWVFLPKLADQAQPELIGALVKVRAVIGRHVSESYERLGAQLFVDNPRKIVVESLAPATSFSTPPSTIQELRATGTNQRWPRPVHLRGTVFSEGPGMFLLQDRTGMIPVHCWAGLPIKTGSVWDAIGFPSMGRLGPELADASVRLAPDQSSAATIVPLRISAADIVRGSLDGKRVHLTARLLSQSANAHAFFFQMRDGDERFSAVMRRTDSTTETMRLPPGSVLEVTGFSVLKDGSPGSPKPLLILIDSPADIVVLEQHVWLTLRQRLALLAALILSVILPLVWVRQLRRTVRAQTDLIRARLQAEMQLETKFRRLFERNLAAVYSWQPDGTIIDCNKAFARLLGLKSPVEVIGRSYLTFARDPNLPARLSEGAHSEALSNVQTSLWREDGVAVQLLANITPVETESGMVFETTAIDVTQLRENQRQLQEARDAAVLDSLNDPLTGLPNRRYLMEKLDDLLVVATRGHETVGLLYIDLDGFKLVNDSLGHAVGDALLLQVAGRLRARMRAGDILARLGGDEFVAIVDRLQSKHDAATLAEDLLDTISRPFLLLGHSLSIGASIGISHFPGDSSNGEQLMQQADGAMYAAKREGKNRVMFYTPEIGSQLHERMTLENMLRGAVGRKEVFVQYQPEFDLADNRLIRFEALARWEHPTLGRISPEKFIPIAEESGIIVALGATIMQMACTEAVRWQSLTGQSIQVAVNVSNIQFRRKGFVEEVKSILDQTGLRPELLQIEVTESVMMGASKQAQETMSRLRAMGIGMAIDDFGTGYSNLSYLPSMAFDALKIDRSFMLNLELQPETESMIRTLITLAHNLGMRVIVEGVETEQQLALIKTLGADEVQGYLLGRPTTNPKEHFMVAVAS